LYQKEKYMIQAGTTPDSGIPRKNRAATRPPNELTAAMQQTIVPKQTMTQGKYLFPENLFMTRFDGMSSSVTMK